MKDYILLPLPSWRNVRSFLMTGNRGIIGGCRFWLLRTLRYFAIFLDGSNKSCRSWNSFSYLLGSFSQVVRSLATGAKFKPLETKEAHNRNLKNFASIYYRIHVLQKVILIKPIKTGDIYMMQPWTEKSYIWISNQTSQRLCICSFRTVPESDETIII